MTTTNGINNNNTNDLNGQVSTNEPKNPLKVSITPPLSNAESLASTHRVTVGPPPNDKIRTFYFKKAKEDAERGVIYCQNMQKFGFTEDMRFEIAKIAASSNARDISHFIQDFDLNENMRFEIAKIAAAHDALGTIKHLQNYGLTDQVMLLEIYNICFETVKKDASQNGNEKISKNIRDYGFTEDQRFVIAKIVAVKNWRIISRDIQNFDLNEDMRFEIAKIVAAQNGESTSRSIKHYELNTDQELQILQICFHQIATVALKTSDFNDLKSFLEIQNPTNMKLFTEEAFNRLKTFAMELGVSGKVLDSFEAIIFGKHTSLLQQQKDIFWFGAWVVRYASYSNPEAIRKSPLCDDEIIPFLTCLCKLTDSNLRDTATQALTFSYTEIKQSLKKLMTKRPDYLYLVILFSTVIGFDGETTEKLLNELASKYYKHPKLIGPINELMSMLQRSTGLSVETKKQLLQLVFLNPPVKGQTEPKPKFNGRVSEYHTNQKNWVAALHSLLYFGQEMILNSIKDVTTLVNQWQKYMDDTFYIRPDAMAQFFPTFGSSKRHPNGLITYATRLQTLPNEEKDRIMPLLGKFAGAVLHGTFPEVRYSFANNKHLETVFSGKDSLLTKWKTSLPIKIENTSQEIAQTTSPLELVQKLMRDALENHHLGADQDSKYPALNEILKGNFNDNQLTNEELNYAVVLNPTTDLTQMQSALRKLQELFPDESSQFHHDLKGMVATLETPQSTESWTIEDTDAWEDILMMGTEVDNSCQSIYREPNTNKCLLSSMLDGKNRLMIARNATGKIVGRVVLRVLRDEVQKKPVLFVEGLYTHSGTHHDKLQRDILEGCKQKATSMGLALVASPSAYNNLKAPKYPGTLQALGGPAPYEYVDSLGGIKIDGQYSIQGGYLIQSAPHAILQFEMEKARLENSLKIASRMYATKAQD